VKCPDHVDGVKSLPIFVGHGVQIGGRHKARRAGVVDQDVNPPESFGGRFNHSATGGVVRDVGLDGERISSQRLDVGDRAQGVIPRLGVVHKHRATLTRQFQCRGAADPSAAARHNRDFAFEVHDIALRFVRLAKRIS
jgi:hypothetical protein